MGPLPDSGAMARHIGVNPRVLAAAPGATAAAVAGLGIISTGLIGCRAELASSALVRVLPDWHGSASEIHAVFPAAGRRRLRRAPWSTIWRLRWALN